MLNNYEYTDEKLLNFREITINTIISVWNAVKNKTFQQGDYHRLNNRIDHYRRFLLDEEYPYFNDIMHKYQSQRDIFYLADKHD